jgi:glycosyltransferase involved in cell wall biosynthesis
MSNALLEAMAAARPIVATDVGANRRLLGGGEFGVLVPPDDPGAIADALDQLLDSFAAARQMAQEAQRHAAVHYSREGMRQRFEQFYERLCA